MINILSHTNSPLSLEWWKYYARRLLNVSRGPDAVRQSLFRGLNALNIPFEHNHLSASGPALVLSGTEALKQALEAKAQGRISRIIAGPNIVVHPREHNELICHRDIDIILVPSAWTKDYWINVAPELSEKIKVWPAGVAPAMASSRKGPPIIYNKLKKDSPLKEIMEQIGADAIVFTYGSFSRHKYLEALKQAPYLIYLAESESQGLALQEAWAHDIPTLVNYSDTWRNGDMTWHAPQINAPYLTPELGMVFDNISDIPGMIDSIKDLHPKNYCDENLSDTVCAQKLLELI